MNNLTSEQAEELQKLLATSTEKSKKFETIQNEATETNGFGDINIIPKLFKAEAEAQVALNELKTFLSGIATP